MCILNFWLCCRRRQPEEEDFSSCWKGPNLCFCVKLVLERQLFTPDWYNPSLEPASWLSGWEPCLKVTNLTNIFLRHEFDLPSPLKWTSSFWLHGVPSLNSFLKRVYEQNTIYPLSIEVLDVGGISQFTLFGTFRVVPQRKSHIERIWPKMPFCPLYQLEQSWKEIIRLVRCLSTIQKKLSSACVQHCRHSVLWFHRHFERWLMSLSIILPLIVASPDWHPDSLEWHQWH